ncbi:hypothetical protein BC835DRAFT_1293734 [Cytidiella melzeri]|nr:hypothetical protein BC835DRAFT_1293734 [Cytidiella melzeri]
MVVVVTKAQRYLSSNREIRTARTRIPWRHRTKTKNPQHKSQTPAEKQARTKQRKEKNENVNKKLNDTLSQVWKLAETLFEELGTHSVKYWYERLLQQSGKKKSTRQTSRWNAFQSKEVKAMNDALPAGAPRPKLDVLVAGLRDKWNSLSKEEQAAATEDDLARITELREMKKTAAHSVPLNAFHDARATLSSLEALHNRTGLEMLLVAVRTDSQSVVCPQVWTTGDPVNEFFQLTNKISLSDFAGKFECYCLSGVQGDKLIFDRLCELYSAVLLVQMTNNQIVGDVARPIKIKRMFYTDFEHHLTEKFGIIVVNWPLPIFVSPGAIGSRLELQTLYNAWSTGSTYFRQLSPAELEAWQSNRFKEKVAASQPETSGTACGNGPSTALSSDTPADPPTFTPGSASASTSTIDSTHTTMQGAAMVSDQPVLSNTAPYTSILAISGTSVVTKKPRKQRADKGKKRGPNAKSKSAAQVEASAVSSEI